MKTEYRLYGARPDKPFIGARRSLAATVRLAQRLSPGVTFRQQGPYTWWTDHGTYTIIARPMT